MTTPHELWERYKRHVCVCEPVGLTLDISRMSFPDDFLARMTDPMMKALDAMAALEQGAIANADENRRVGHYWLRAPQLAPDAEITSDIVAAVEDVKRFATDVHDGAITPQRGDGFYVVLWIGIGGSALGPQLLTDALAPPDAPMMMRFLDNTDPAGIDRILAELGEMIEQTLTVVVSKSGGTRETRNGMIEVAAAYQRAGLAFPRHAVAVTTDGSELHRQATNDRWLCTFPMWDWVGGRTSVTSPVGLLCAALQGIDVDAFLAGAKACDELTRSRDVRHNPAALLAMMWHYAGNGTGERDMVVLPYCDGLSLFGKYLQQLVMESIGKQRDRAGRIVHQGLTVYGNKGSTDQHAFVQQLIEGSNDFFVTFLDVLRDRSTKSIPVGENVTTGDYRSAFLQGTRAALSDRGRESLTITLDELSAHSLGALVALFERAVGLYAELINVNAYHQPGVEAGKTAAEATLALQRLVLKQLHADSHASSPAADAKHPSRAGWTADEIAAALGKPDSIEPIHHILEHAAANADHGILRIGPRSLDAQYRARSEPRPSDQIRDR